MVTFDFIKTPITQIADYIILYAAKSNASDIHFDPREDGMMVRIRVDGDLQDYTKIPKTYERNLTTRLKLLANMNITESRLPQDGAIKGNFSGTYLDMRVSSLPLNEGEKIVIRILDYSRSLQGIESLGFNEKNLVKIKRMMAVPNGIILVTGATGSGKSTTTYSMLQALNKPETNIITVEDPIEMNMEGLNQVQVNSEIGMTFAAALRSILRQDPNVILIGEIRDSETAQIAVRASITGHLVLSTIHTNNTLATVERLLDMNVERYLLSSALTGIISQRLAKKICTKCRVKRETTKYEKKVFRHFMKLDVNEIWDANADGCDSCRNGYKGRVAIHEVLEIDDNVKDALSDEKLEKEDLREMVYTDNVITMLQDALGKVLNGSTSFEEVYRVIEIDTDDDNYSAELTKAFSDKKTSTPKNESNDIVSDKDINVVVNNNQPSNTLPSAKPSDATSVKIINTDNLIPVAPSAVPVKKVDNSNNQNKVVTAAIVPNSVIPQVTNNINTVQQPIRQVAPSAVPNNVIPQVTNNINTVQQPIRQVAPSAVPNNVIPQVTNNINTVQQPIRQVAPSAVPNNVIPQVTNNINAVQQPIRQVAPSAVPIKKVDTGNSQDKIVTPAIVPNNINTVQQPIRQVVPSAVPIKKVDTSNSQNKIVTPAIVPNNVIPQVNNNINTVQQPIRQVAPSAVPIKRLDQTTA